MRNTFLLAIVLAGIAAAQSGGLSLSGKKILLSYEDTKYKKALIGEMADILKKDSADVAIVLHSKKSGLSADPSQYDAIFISNSGVLSKVRPWIADWLNINKAFAGKILLHTTKTKKWTEAVTVDAISSASAKKAERNDAALFVERLRKRFAPADTSAGK